MTLKTLAMGGAAVAMLAGGIAHASVVDRPTFKVGGLVVVWGGVDGQTGQNVVSDFYLLDGTNATDLISGDVDGDADTIVTGDLISLTGETSGGITDVGAGDSDGLLDADDTLSAFGIDANTDVSVGGNSTHSGRFHVASNTGFSIQATAVETKNDFTVPAANPLDPDVKLIDLANVKFAMTRDITGTTNSLDFGANAQDPATATGDGFVANIDDLADIGSSSTEVYKASSKTAATPGRLAAQSIRFNTSYTLDTDLGTAGDQGFDLSQGTGEYIATVTYTIFNP